MDTKTHTLLLASCLGLFACGGSDSGSDEGSDKKIDTEDNSIVQTGIFTDSPVQGLSYRTESQSGITGANGEFTYIEGEQVSFSIGGLAIANVNADAIITPLDVMGTEDIDHQGVVNLARLLQTLDVDGDPTNGITINVATQQAITEAMQIDFNNSFDVDVVNVLTAVDKTLEDMVTAGAAVSHLAQTLSMLPPKQFSREYLEGKTLYMVGFGEGDVNGKEVDDVAYVAELVFNTDMTVTYTGLINSDGQQTFSYDINRFGLFHVDEDLIGHGHQVSCGSTSDYIKADWIEGVAVDDVDLFFFDRQKALDYGNALNGPIPRCNVLKQRVIQQAMISVDGHADDWQGIQVGLLDPQGDSPKGATDITALYLAQDETNLYIRLDRASLDFPIYGAYYNYWIYFKSETGGSEYAVELFHDGKGMTYPRLLDATGTNFDYEKLVDLTVLSQVSTQAQVIEVAVPKSYLNQSAQYTVDFFTHFSHTADTWDDRVEEYDVGYDNHSVEKYLFRLQ